MRNILKYMTVAAAAFSLASCSDWINEALEIDPSDRYAVPTVWSSEDNADLYLLGLYSIIRENDGKINGDGNLS